MRWAIRLGSRFSVCAALLRFEIALPLCLQFDDDILAAERPNGTRGLAQPGQISGETDVQPEDLTPLGRWVAFGLGGAGQPFRCWNDLGGVPG